MAPERSNPSPVPGRSAGLGEYLKRAFTYRWNILLFLGGLGASLLSPWPDAVMPLVMAAEAAYLGGLVSHPRFREAVDAQVYQEDRGSKAAAASQSLAGILNRLSPEARTRFQKLRGRCLEMRSLAQGVRGSQNAASSDLSTSAIDRLLWVFLRLLLSDDALARFQAGTDADEIRQGLAQSMRKLEEAKDGDQRVIHSLEDSVAAYKQRLENYERAEKNANFVQLELDRVETKIQALIESTINQQDPDVLTSQIEGVTESMQSTEKAIRELNELTGIVDQMQEPPAILEADWRQVAQ